jgi:hypothetical protein
MTLNKAILEAFDYIKSHDNVNLIDKVELRCIFDEQKTHYISILPYADAEDGYFSEVLKLDNPQDFISAVVKKPISLKLLLSDGWKVCIHESQIIDLGV